MSVLPQQHRIQEISYRLDRIECTCGEVMRANPRAGEWERHRRAVGAPVATVGQTIGRRLTGPMKPRRR